MALESIRGAMGVLMRGNMCTLTTSCDVCNSSHTHIYIYTYLNNQIINQYFLMITYTHTRTYIHISISIYRLIANRLLVFN